MLPFLFSQVFKLMQNIKKKKREEERRQRLRERQQRLNIQDHNTSQTIGENTEQYIVTRRKRTEAEKDEIRARKRDRYMKAWTLVVVGVVGFFFVPFLAVIIKAASDHVQLYNDNYTFSSYTFNFTVALQSRRENMKKYSYKYNIEGIDRRQKLSLREFSDVYDGKWPVLLTDVVPKWNAFKRWNKEFFLRNYGKERVVMKAVPGDLDKAESYALPLELFLKHSHEGQNRSWTYLEDELFLPMRKELYNDIGQIVYMLDDYFQLFPKEIRPWDAMLLWGTAFSRSTLHIDPYNWTGTNAVLSGRKRWKLYPPDQDTYLYPFQGRTSNFPLNCYKYNSPIDAYSYIDETKYPLFYEARAVEFDQLPGELLFIPTGWFHQAFNVEETVAVSSQMTNNYNYKSVLEEIFKVGNLPRKGLPSNFDTMPPDQQIRVVMQKLPSTIIKRGTKVTEDVLRQVAETRNKHDVHSKSYQHEDF